MATRAALPLAGGFEPPLPGAVETVSPQQPTYCTPSASHSLSSSPRGGAKGTSCQRVAKLATPTGALQNLGAAAKLHTPSRGGPSPPEANATERFVEWKSSKTSEFVGVANLATRAALPLAGGFEPPLPGAVETVSPQQPTYCTPSASHSLSSSPRGGAKGTSCQRVAKLATPTGAVETVSPQQPTKPRRLRRSGAFEPPYHHL